MKEAIAFYSVVGALLFATIPKAKVDTSQKTVIPAELSDSAIAVERYKYNQGQEKLRDIVVELQAVKK